MRKKLSRKCLLALVVLGIVAVAPWRAEADDAQVKIGWEEVATGRIPSDWMAAATNQKGPLATWQVVEDPTSPSGGKVLAMTRQNHEFGGTFNICWTDTIRFLDGEIEVRFKANRGKEDQGGGVIWRVQDKENYYIARFNPLENNFRIYYVRDGARKTLADIQVALPAGKWHTMKIMHRGTRIEGYLNHKKLLEATDDQFTRTGGVGLWTKADAVTSFDDLVVRGSGAEAEVPTADAQMKKASAEAAGAKSAFVTLMLRASKLSLAEAIEIAERRANGATAYEAQMEIEKGRVVYETKILVGKARREVVVDAATGEVLSDRAEDE